MVGFLPLFIFKIPLLNAECVKQISRKICPLTFHIVLVKKLAIRRKKSTFFLNVSGDSEAETEL